MYRAEDKLSETTNVMSKLTKELIFDNIEGDGTENTDQKILDDGGADKKPRRKIKVSNISLGKHFLYFRLANLIIGNFRSRNEALLTKYRNLE